MTWRWKDAKCCFCPTRLATSGIYSKQYTTAGKTTNIYLAYYSHLFYLCSYFSDKVSQPFECVVALLRLGKKYEMQNLYDEALDCLKVEFPAIYGSESNWNRIPYHTGIFFDTINLARELDIRSILPRCFFYITLEHTTQEIFDGVRRDDGSLAILSLKDQRAYILALSSMQCAQAEHMFTWLEQASFGCTSPADCTKTKHEFFVRLWRPPGQNIFLDWDSSWEKGLCMACVKAGKTSHEAGSRRFWDLLPTFFSLPEWKDLTPCVFD